MSGKSENINIKHEKISKALVYKVLDIFIFSAGTNTVYYDTFCTAFISFGLIFLAK